MQLGSNAIVRCDIPSVNYDLIPLDGYNDRFFTLTRAVEVVFDGATYKLSDYPNAISLFVELHRVGTNLYLTLTCSIKESEPITILENVSALGKALKVSPSVTTSGFANYTYEIDDAYAQYFTVITTTSYQAVMNLTNCQVINNPLINKTPYINGAPYVLDENNPIIVRANDGFIFTSQFTLTSGDHVLNEYIEVSEDYKELKFYSQRSYDDNGVTKYYNVPNMPTLTLTAIAESVPSLDITNTLTHATNSNTDTTTLYGASYEGTITADVGYYISNVKIIMGGEDVTNFYYDNGHINIPNVTGDLEIIVDTTVNPTITNNLTGCTTSNSATSSNYGAPYTATLTPLSGYSLEDASVLITIDGIEQYNVYSNGVINIPSVTGNLVITVNATTIKTFTFKSMDGNTVFLTLQLVKITSILFTIVGNTRTLRINGVDHTWVQIVPSKKILTGLSLTANSTRYTIPLGVEVNVNFNETMSFYEVIVDEGSQVDSFSLMLYKNSAEIERVDKSSYLTFISTLNGTLKESANIIAPQIRIEYANVVNFNYVYIPIWNRYYFVTDIQYGVKNMVVISLRVDVLMSHKNAIYNQRGLVARNEYTYNENLVDAERIVKNNPIVDVIEATTFFNPDASQNIVVNVIGGD